MCENAEHTWPIKVVMSDSPSISLGMPVYNGAAHMERALESILAQTLGDFELLISDNGSDDDTADIAAGYAARDPRVKVATHRTNQGASWNFEYVFRHATGKYFAWTAADDYWDVRYLERCVRELESRPDAVTCVSEIQPVTSLGIPVGEPYNELAIDADSVRSRWRAALRSSRLHSAAYGVMRRENLGRTRFVPPYLGCDHVLMAELALQGKIVVVPEVLSYKSVPGEHEQYRSHVEMLRYLGSSAHQPWLLWGNMTKELIHGVYHVAPSSCSKLLLSLDAATSYFTTGGLLNDAKRAVLRLRPAFNRAIKVEVT